MPLGSDAIATDASFRSNLDLDGDTAVADFYKSLVPAAAEKPSATKEKTEPVKEPAEKKEPDPETKEDPETPAEKSEVDGETKDPETLAEKAYADDGAYVKIKVGDEEHEVPVKDLQRLFGQEKALTQKSMEVAEQRKTVDAEMAKNVAASTALLERAKARFAPYSKIDFLLAAKELSSEDYTNLRAAAMSAYEDVQFLENNLNGFMQAAQQRQHEAIVTQAKEAIKVLSGPVDKGGIEGWTEKVYQDIRGFAIGAGLNEQVVNNLVDPVAISLLNDAMLYRRGKSKVVTTVVNKTPKKVVKTTRSPERGLPGDKTNVNAALKKLVKSGSTDDAADAFMAGWASRDADQ